MSTLEPLLEYRCTCGKLLFRGVLVVCTVEIKCKRCSSTRTFAQTPDVPCTFTFFVNREDTIADVCGGVALVGLERKALIGKPLSELFSLVRDIPSPARLLDMVGREKPYQLEHHTLLIKDTPLPVESYIVPDGGGYRVFNVVRS